MSSIVKKSTHFTPKVKKAIKRKTATPTSSGTQKSITPASPPASQIDYKQQQQQQPETKQDQSQTPIPYLESPPSTQIPLTQAPEDNASKPAFRLTLSSDAPTTTTTKEKENDNNEEHEDIDPKDASKKLEHQSPPPPVSTSAVISDDEESIFKPTTMDSNTRSRRQSSSGFSQRRLSGIHPPGIRSRSGSVSMKQHPLEDSSIGSSTHIPARIGIPIAKPIKRRRSSAQSRTGAAMKRMSVLSSMGTVSSASVISTAITTKEHTPAPEENPVQQQLSTSTKDGTTPPGSPKTSKKGVSAEFVVGIDPISKRLRKFRRKDAPKQEQPDRVVDAEGNIIEAEVIPDEPENLITTISSVYQLPRKVKDEDADLFGEVEVDVEEMTMAELCKATLPVGKVSENFQLVVEAKKTLSEQRDERRRTREIARAERVSLEEAKMINEKQKREEMRKRGEQVDDDEPDQSKPGPSKKSFLDEDEPPKSAPSLQLTMTDGKISFNEDSAVVVKPRADASGRSVEQSNPFANPITSTTYGKRTHTEKWTPEELVQFYKAISMFGTDFSLISQLFPYRTRKQVKAKFVLEERRHPEVVEMALKRKLPTNFNEYCESTGKSIQTLDYYNEELRKVRLEHEQSLSMIMMEKEKALKEDAEASRRREIEIRTGAKPMSRAEKLKELRKNEMVVGSIDEIKKQRENEEILKQS
ncbi:uncharacterized protein J8A68_004674 [[Candida] subhashii]|uniref:SANT domain-containing protein n=1 Tax=[Candida] subhashii TaxID=561895 RepID=A0A8J5UF83_9ASCO|nr:uncharacterized protein J8A68_004674 [[Candida] subhashii]KAG7661818.1 hypothetical protein J8A68_004674 [[Candida] subhashii]